MGHMLGHRRASTPLLRLLGGQDLPRFDQHDAQQSQTLHPHPQWRPAFMSHVRLPGIPRGRSVTFPGRGI